MNRSLSRVCAFSIALFSLTALTGCGNGGGGGHTGPPAVSVAITTPSSSSISIGVGQTQQFTATVTGNCSGAGCGVIWTVNGVVGGNSTYGTIQTGTSVAYQAPAVVPSPATFQITATSVANSSVSASVAVTITGPAPGISITSPSSPSVNVAVSGTLAITATVTGLANTDVTWTVNGVANGNSTFGTLSGAGTGSGDSVTYTAPAAVPNPATFNITATSAANTSLTASLSVTVTSGVSISITSPANPDNIVAGSTVAFSAVVTGSTNTDVTWTVNGVTDGDSTDGIMVQPGPSTTYVAPIQVPSPATFDIVATSQADSTQSASVTVTITAPAVACGSGDESVLDGQYAFGLAGFSNTGFNAVVGSLTFDGRGNITTGEIDDNGVASKQNHGAVTAGFYSVGDDNDGCATIVSPFQTWSVRFQLGAVSSGVATAGHIMEFDPASPSAFVATGQMFAQVPSDFPAGLNGGYVHFLAGWDNSTGGRIVCGGVHTNSGGNISNVEETCNDKGNVTHTGPVTSNDGSYTAIDSSGRFTETVGSSHLVGYTISSGGTPGVPTALTMTTDSNPVMAGEAIQQQGTFSQSTLNGTFVAYGNGVNSSTSGKVFFGIYTSTGAGTLTQNAYYENDGGTWVPGNTSPTYNYSTDVYGDTTLSTNTVADAGHLYQTGYGWSVFIDVDSGASAGFAAAQTGSGSLSNSTLDGGYFGGTTEIINQAAQSDGLLVNVTGSSGAVAISTDSASTNALSAGQTSTDTISINSSGVIVDTAQPTQAIGLVINSNYFLIANHAGSPYPTILLLGPAQLP